MNKRLLLMSVLLAAIAGVILITENMRHLKPQQTTTLELLTLLQKPLVQKITVESGSTTINLSQTTDKYWLSDATPPFLVNPNKVAQLLDFMNQAKVQREIADSPAERAQLQLDGGTQLKLQIGPDMFSYTLGKTHTNGGQFILAPKLSSKILLIDRPLPVLSSLSEWQDLRFLTIGREQITSITLRPAPDAKKSPAKLLFNKETKKFTLDELTDADRPKLNEAAFNVAENTLLAIPLSGAEPLTPEKQAMLQGVAQDTAQMEFELASQTKVLINLSKVNKDSKNHYYATVRWDDSHKAEDMTKIGAYLDAFIYNSSATTFEQVNKGREEFLSITP